MVMHSTMDPCHEQSLLTFLAFFASALATSSLGVSFLCLFLVAAAAGGGALAVVALAVVVGGGAVSAGVSWGEGRWPLNGEAMKPRTDLMPEVRKSREPRRFSVMMMVAVMVSDDDGGRVGVVVVRGTSCHGGGGAWCPSALWYYVLVKRHHGRQQ